MSCEWVFFSIYMYPQTLSTHTFQLFNCSMCIIVLYVFLNKTWNWIELNCLTTHLLRGQELHAPCNLVRVTDEILESQRLLLLHILKDIIITHLQGRSPSSSHETISSSSTAATPRAPVYWPHASNGKQVWLCNVVLTLGLKIVWQIAKWAELRDDE